MTGDASNSIPTQTPMERQTSSRYLINEQPVEFLPSLAEAIGVNEAIFLQKLHWWLRGSGHVRNGRRWIYNSYAQWHQQFPYWCEHTIRRIVERLKTLGLIETANFNRVQADRTMWYTINHEAVEALLAASHVSPQAASSCVQVGQMEWPDRTDGVANLDTLPEKDPREGSAETSREKREGERTRAQDVARPAPEMAPQEINTQTHPVRPTPTPIWRMPADYNPSAELQAALTERYPMLNFDEQMIQIRSTEFLTPKTDLDALLKKWFSQEAEKFHWRKEKATAPGQGNGGIWRDATSTDWRTQETIRQHQAALAKYNIHVAKQAAMDVNYEDITHDTQRVPGLSRSVDGPRVLLPQPAQPRICRPAVF